MRRHLCGLLLLGLLLVTAQACHRPITAQVDSPAVYLWEVSSPTSRAYLLGSIHLARPELYPLDPAIESAYAASSVLVVEADIGGANAAGAMASMMTAGFYTDGRTLSGELPEETWRRLEAHLESRGIHGGMFETMQPWMAAVTVSLLEFQRMGFDANHGIDKHFLDLARAEGKTIGELESVDFQVELLSGFSKDEQEQFLAYAIDEAGELESLADTMLDAWHRGDAGKIQELTDRYQNDARMRRILDAILYDRNETMVEKIHGYLEQAETHFVVVGAAHIGGARGILDLLEQSGRYRIQQVAARADGPESVSE